MKRRILFLAAVWLATVALMAIQKPLFLLFYHAEASGIGALGWWQVLYHGLTLDMTVAGYVTALPLLAVLLSLWVPLGTNGWRRILMVWFAVVSLLTAAVVALDLGLYGHWGFRLDGSVLQYLASPKEAAASVTASEWITQTAIFVLCAALMIWVYGKVVRILRTPRLRLPVRAWGTGVVLLLGGLCFLSIRGGASVATANVSKVYFSDRLFLNHAAVNPLFSFLSTAGDNEDYASEYPFFPEAERAALFDEIRGDRTGAPQLRVLDTLRPNVAVVILESFARTIMDAEVEGRPVMPHMRRLKGEGVWFENFFANSFRTDRGEVAILNGFPAQTKMSVMKLPAKSQTLPSIARSLGREGYRTSFLYGGDLNFTNQASYMYGTGWQELTWQKDLRFDAPTSKWGYADDVVTEHFGDRILALSAEGEPFLAGMLTLSSHEPFDVPYDEFDDPMLNAASFADACIGRLVERLKASPAWDDLLLVLVADHGYGYPYGIPYNGSQRHRIPMLWLGGAVKEPHAVDTYASQIDLAATLLAQMGVDHSDFAYSKDIFSPDVPKFGYWCFNDGFGIADAEGETIYDAIAGRFLKDSLPGTRRSERGKALLQTTYKDIGER